MEPSERLRQDTASHESYHRDIDLESQGSPSSQGLRQRTGGGQEQAPIPRERRDKHHTSIGQDEQRNMTELAAPAPERRESSGRTFERSVQPYKRNESLGYEEEHDLTETTAPVPVESIDQSGHWRREEHLESPENLEKQESSQQKDKSFEYFTQVYILSHLIFWSILGTLARLGVQWITFYPGAPIAISNIWANFGGTLVMGFLSEDRKLFMEEWGELQSKSHEGAEKKDEESDGRWTADVRDKHLKVKKTIPLFVGLTTGFCGSFTSFSTFMRDIFYALSNDMPSPHSHPGTASITTTVPRNGGYSFEAILAVIILTVTASIGALKLGAHMAIAADRIMPTMPFKVVRRYLDPLAVFLGVGCWVGAVVLAVVPPDRPGGPESNGSWGGEVWRGQVLFALVFSPLGCILRFYLSAKLNGIIRSFPLGTFTANIFGTAIFGMVYDLQRAPLQVGSSVMVGGGRVGCQVLQGIEDGFCGTLTTVSTWIVEVTTLQRKHGYMYGAASVLSGLAAVVIIIGSVFWSIGLSSPVCTVEVS